MIKIRCSILEQVRLNPTAYGQLLASNDKAAGGGTHGMFAYWQDSAVKVTNGEHSVAKGLKELKSAFLSFADNPTNLAKQEFLISRFEKYCKEFERKGLKSFDSKHHVKWQMTPQVLLTGMTPIVAKDDKSFHAYFFSEQQTNWREELRFPLLQSYIAENNLKCPTDQIQIGNYCLSKNNFDLISFSKGDIKTAIEETRNIFDTLGREYAKKKPLTK